VAAEFTHGNGRTTRQPQCLSNYFRIEPGPALSTATDYLLPRAQLRDSFARGIASEEDLWSYKLIFLLAKPASGAALTNGASAEWRNSSQDHSETTLTIRSAAER
jgi:hypothetical protein